MLQGVPDAYTSPESFQPYRRPSVQRLRDMRIRDLQLASGRRGRQSTKMKYVSCFRFRTRQDAPIAHAPNDFLRISSATRLCKTESTRLGRLWRRQPRRGSLQLVGMAYVIGINLSSQADDATHVSRLRISQDALFLF